jgi:LysM repeat protein
MKVSRDVTVGGTEEPETLDGFEPAANVAAVELKLWSSGIACPALGMHGDLATRFLVPSSAHRCSGNTGKKQPVQITAEHQQEFCLTSRYRLCSAWQGSDRRGIEKQGGGWHSPWERSWRAKRTIVAAAVAVLIAIVVVGISPLGFNRPSAQKAQAVTVPRVAPNAAKTDTSAVVDVAPAGQPEPAVTVPPVPRRDSLLEHAMSGASAAMTAASTTARTRPGTATAAVRRSYTVQPGDSLTLLAERFGVSIYDLAAANDLSPFALLLIDQKLFIPVAVVVPSTR